MTAPPFDDTYPIDKPPRRFPWRLIFIILILCALAFAAWHFFGNSKAGGRNGGKPPQQVPVVSAAPVIRRDVPLYLDGLGTVQASNIVTVHSRVDGELIDAPFAEGQDIKKGAVLAHIDPRLFKAAYDQAVATTAKDQALLENARLDLERYSALGNTISVQAVNTQATTVKQLTAQLRADQAAADNAKTQLGYTTITAPIDGRTGIRLVDVGNIIHAGDANGLVVITQIEPVNVVFSLPQQNLVVINRQINADGALQVVAMDQDGQTVLDTGKLNLIDNQIDQTTGTIRLQAEFPNKDHLLWPGGFTTTRLLLQTLPAQLAIPTVAIQRGPQNTYVFVLKDDRTVEIRNVTTGTADGADTIVTDGLQEGERVVTDGTSKLQDKAKVMLPEDVKPAPAADDGKTAPHNKGAR